MAQAHGQPNPKQCLWLIQTVNMSLLHVCSCILSLISQLLSYVMYFFKASALRPILSRSCDVRLSVLVCVCMSVCLSPPLVTFFEAFLGPQITWSVPSLSLVSKKRPPFFSFLFARKITQPPPPKKILVKSRNLSKIVLVLLFALVERFFVYRMRFFF